MTTPTEAAKNTVEIGKRHIADQCQRIEQQHELIKRLEQHGPIDLAAEAVRHLGQMKETLGQMEADYAGPQARLAQATVDEEVEQDMPM